MKQRKLFVSIVLVLMAINLISTENQLGRTNNTLADIANFPSANAEFVKTCETGYIPNKDEYLRDGYWACEYDYADCCNENYN